MYVLTIIICGIYIWERYRVFHKIQDFTSIETQLDFRKNINIPFIVHNQLGPLSKLNIAYLRKKYGDHKISVLRSDDAACTVRGATLIQMKLSEYIDNYIKGNVENKERYYFRSEDSYRFIEETGLSDLIEATFKDKVAPYIRMTYSFWMGPKESTTTFHYDTDATNFLCLVEGQKTVLMISPSAENEIVPLDTPHGDFYTVFDPRDDERIKKMKNDGSLHEIVMRAGDVLNIPKNIWHAVINNTDTVAFTFHCETLESGVWAIVESILWRLRRLSRMLKLK